MNNLIDFYRRLEYELFSWRLLYIYKFNIIFEIYMGLSIQLKQRLHTKQLTFQKFISSLNIIKSALLPNSYYLYIK
jgi:hypothetical protein